MSLTVGEVALIAAGIGLVSPFIAYWATARLDRGRWIREQRSEVYIEMLAIYGRMARKASHQEDQYTPPSSEEWRLLQARVEAFTSDRVFAIRDPYLRAWNHFLDALGAVGEAADSSATDQRLARQQLVDEHAHAVRQHYDELRTAIRKELRVRGVSRTP